MPSDADRSAAYDAAGPVRRVVRRAVTLAPVAAGSARALPTLDRLAVRLTGGRATLSGWMTGLPIVELGTTGARSGEPRTHRVMGVPSGDGALLVVAANFGSDRRPAWYFNLRARPEATIDGEPHTVRELTGDEREAGFARALALNPGWQRFGERAGREIPLRLRPLRS